MESVAPRPNAANKKLEASLVPGKTTRQDPIIFHLTVSARINPFNKRSPGVPISPGYGFCFSRVTSNDWTDRKSSGPKPLEGYHHSNDSEYIKEAQRAQLIGVDDADGSWVGYEPKFDRSKNGLYCWENHNTFTWVVRWYMNDRSDGYADNYGTAEMELFIFKL
jgi:hypothetical protein